MKAWHKFMSISFPYKGFGFLDDFIYLLSPKAYAKFVLPLHKKLSKPCVSKDLESTFAEQWSNTSKTLRDKLHIRWLDTGFPLNLEKAREILGEDVIIMGNLHIATPYE